MKKIFEKLRGLIKLSRENNEIKGVSERAEFVAKMKKLGFTLAEVLVVVAIIGVISMIMIRVWHGSIDGQEFDTGVQKMISRLSQALRMNRVTHDFENWNDIFGREGGDNIQKDLLSRNLKVVKEEDSEKLAEKYPDGKFFNYSDGENKIYTLKDGIQYSIFQNEDETIMIENEPVKVIMVIDVNGTHKGPNQPGKDVRMLALTVNRADEFKGGEPWCGDECVTLNGEPVKASVLSAEPMRRTEAYYNCTQQGKTLASIDEMEALLSTPAGRTAAGASDTSTTCYSTRDISRTVHDRATYICYNPNNDNVIRGYHSWANFQELIYAGEIRDSNNNSISNLSGYSTPIRGVCIEDKALAQAKQKYPNADGVINGTPYKLVSACLDDDEDVRTAAKCSAADSNQEKSITDKETWNYVNEFCEKNGMRLLSKENEKDIAFISSAAQKALGIDTWYWLNENEPYYSEQKYRFYINENTGEPVYGIYNGSNSARGAGICVGDL